MKTVIPDIILEQYVLGELSESKMSEIKKISESDSSIYRRINDIKTSNAEILAKYPPSLMCEKISEAVLQAGKGNKTKLLHFIPIPAIGAVAATILFLFIFPIRIHHPSTSGTIGTISSVGTSTNTADVIRTKGGNSYLGIFRKTNSEPEQLKDGSVAHEGDILQIVFQSTHPYGVIFSIDGRGNVTLHYPDSGQSSTKIEKGKRIFLEKAYQLDNAPEFERFFFIASDVGVNTDYILTRARSLAKNTQLASSEQLSIAGTKETSILIKKD